MNAGYLNSVLLGILIFLTVYLYFFSEMNSYFSQDDFFHFSTVINKKVSDIPSFFFTLSNEYAFYRPISRETYSLIALKLFGLNPLPYHLVNIAFILINGILGIKFLQQINEEFNNVVFKFIFLFLYLFSAVHSVELYYLSSIQTLLSSTFTLLSLILFLKKRFISVLFFTLAFMSHESSVVFLPIAFFLNLAVSDEKLFKRIRISIVRLFPFILIFLTRVLLHVLGFGLDSTSTYSPSLLPKSVLNTSIWYLLWSFGLPEMLVDFATLRFQFNPNLFKYYGEFTKIVFPSFLLMICTLAVMLFKVRKFFFKKNTQFLLLAFTSSIIPIIFFPSHKFIYYLSFPIILFTGFVSALCFEYSKQSTRINFLILVFLFFYILISFQTIKINKITYWAAKRANSAQFIIKDIKNRFPVLERGSAIFIKDDPNYPFITKEWGTSSKQAFYILSGSDAFRLIYNDPTIKVYYEAINSVPKSTLKNLVIYEVHFPY